MAEALVETLTDADLRGLSARQFVSSEFNFEPDEQDVPGDGGATVKQRRISGLAYSGEPVDRSFGKMIIDLASLRMDGKGQIPIFFRHNSGGMCDSLADARLGMWDSVKIDPKAGVMASGFLLNKPLTDEITRDAKGGYKWQLSVGVTDGRLERIPMGETREINGRTCGGGMYVYTAGMLREISLVELGADPNTTSDFELRAPSPQHAETFYQRGKGRVAKLLSTMGVSARAILELAREEQGADLDTNGVAALSAAPHSRGASDMATENKPAPATSTQLRTLVGADSDFILSCLDRNLSLADSAVELCGKLHARTQELEAAHVKAVEKLNTDHAQALKAATDKAAELQARIDGALQAGATVPLAVTPGAPAAKVAAKGPVEFAGATGTDPEKDWDACEALRLQWDDKRGAFLKFAKAETRRGRSYLIQIKP